jgi:hypothetical protein
MSDTHPISNKHYQVSTFGRPDDPVEIIVQSRTAIIRYDRWCQREVDRWKATNGRECFLMENSEGLIALFAHAEYQKPVEAEGQ